MLSQPATLLGRFLPGTRQSLLVLAVGLFAALSLVVAACSGDDEDDPQASPAGSVATATATSGATGASQVTPAPGGTLVPLPTQAPAAAATQPAIPTAEGIQVAQMIDLAPCTGESYYEEHVFEGGVPVLTYKDVPVGTPILFPFEEGRLRVIDAKAGAIILGYEVEGVGFLTVQAAGSSTLDRNVAHPLRGTVIGHFAGEFGRLDTHAFEGYQLFAVVGHTQLVLVNDTLFQGQPMDPEVTHCMVLP